jgi:thioester reductase-like protein
VVITGITGYLGAQVCHDFLSDGHFEVRGTVRDPTNEEKLAHLKNGFGEMYQNLEVV